jgi:hypothetical protein
MLSVRQIKVWLELFVQTYGETTSGGPNTTFLAEDGALSNSLGANQVVVDVCLPAHCCCVCVLD